MDAICIDQSDDTREKNHQVAMMGEIFRGASRVFACVGAHANDSYFLMHTLETRQAFFAAVYDGITSEAPEPVFDWKAFDWTGGLPKLELTEASNDAELGAQLLEIRARLIEAFRHFLRRSYLSRVCIFQELYSGNGSVTICCGIDRQPLNALLALSLLINDWINEYYSEVSSIALCKDNSQLMKFWNDLQELASQRGCLLVGSSPTQLPGHLRSLLQALPAFQSQDPRGKIYGVLPSVCWPENTPFPDYTKGRFELAAETLGLLHLQGASDTEFWYEYSMLGLADAIRRLLSVSLHQTTLN